MNKLWLLPFMCLVACSPQLPKRTYQLPPQLNEVSGLYIENANTFWWHNDGGNAPQLFQSDGRGGVTNIVFFEAFQNNDWEDLANDDSGHIYIGDFGNNLNQRRDLRIYIYHPINATIDSILFQYSDQFDHTSPPSKANFDTEAFFWYRDSLHLFSKNHLQGGDYFTKHYSMQATASTPQTAVLKEKVFLKNRVVTAAAISPDGKTVALLSYIYRKLFGFIPYSAASIFLIKHFNGTDFLQGEIYKKRAPYFLLATQFEAIDFLDNETLYVAAEKTLFFPPKAKRVKLKTRDFKLRKQVD